MALVRIEADDGAVGWGEAKAAVGSAGSCSTLVACINDELGPELIGLDARRINEVADRIYNGPRAGYAAARGRVFPILGRRGLTVSAMSGVDMALWDLLGRSLGAPVVDLWGGPCRPDMALYASGGWADVAGIGAELGKYVAAGFSAREDARRRDRRHGRRERGPRRRRPRGARPRCRVDGRCPRNVQRRRGQTLRGWHRGARCALVRGAGERRRPPGDGRSAVRRRTSRSPPGRASSPASTSAS